MDIKKINRLGTVFGGVIFLTICASAYQAGGWRNVLIFVGATIGVIGIWQLYRFLVQNHFLPNICTENPTAVTSTVNNTSRKEIMSFKICACPFCQNAVVFDPDQGYGVLVCPECHREFVPNQQSLATTAKRAEPVLPQAQVYYEPAPSPMAGGDWRYCRNCGKRLSSNAYACPHCGEPVEQNCSYRNEYDDSLGCGWIAAIWLCALLVPFGCLIVIIVSSVLYWSWHHDYPNKARTVNMHGWCSVIVAIVLSLWWGWTVLYGLIGLLHLIR